MSEAKHTPGPWAYGLGYRIRPDRGRDEQGREIGGPTIAELNADADRCCSPPEEIEANGRLMAAAPDLLAACEIIAALDLPNDTLGEYEVIAATWEKARAAIAKARG